ncbi:hypothetical protein M3626_21160 [Psychrobacillus sp. MER TA 17]|nr:hypothetical protein [Psychrobacillus sp. MER TA 17]
MSVIQNFLKKFIDEEVALKIMDEEEKYNKKLSEGLLCESCNGYGQDDWGVCIDCNGTGKS